MDKIWGCFENLLNRSHDSYKTHNLKLFSLFRYIWSKLSKIAIFQFLRVENRNTFRGQILTVFCKFRIFPLFLDIYTQWEKYDILKNHTGSGFENFFTFLPPFRSDVRNTLNFHRKCSIFFVWLVYI